MQLYNTLSQKKEPVTKGDHLRFFVCGPTVYDLIHIGNARVYVFFDAFVRFLRGSGIKTSYLQNITDIDDKILRRAAEEQVSWKTISGRFTKAFFSMMRKLGVISVDTYAPATKFIPDIKKQVTRLIEKGNAYEIPGDGWYFDLSTFPDYGKLSKRTVEQAEDGVSRIDENPNKRNRGDFCIWKFSKPGEPTWPAKFGAGRPGWHIEDTAISEHYFGLQYDLHGGGSDLMFPHHEAEIAQAESLSGRKPFVKIWMHVGMLTVNGKKMSKSIGNVVPMPVFLANYPPILFRFLVLTHHYRSPFDYNPLLLDETRKSLERMYAYWGKANFASKHGAYRASEPFLIQGYEERFKQALEDDFNTPEAIGVLFSLINDTEKNLWRLGAVSLHTIYTFLEKSLGLLGIIFPSPRFSLRVWWLARRREKFRTSRQFMQADDLRKKIERVEYIIEDTPLGPFVWPKHLS